MKEARSTHKKYSTGEILGIIWKTQRRLLIGAIIFTICMLALLYGFSKFREYRISKRLQREQGAEVKTLEQNAHIAKTLCRNGNVKTNSTIQGKRG